MPFRSEAQRKKFGELVKQGKMSKATFDEWNNATGKAKLPDRVGPPTNNKAAAKAAAIKRRFGQ